MFGYVRPSLDPLNREHMELYRAAYCGLCHTLGRRYGLAARLFLNFDLAFLAMLLDRTCQENEKRCLIHPIRKRRCVCQSDTLETVSDYSVILLWWKLRDNMADCGFWSGLKYRLLAAVVRRSYRKACRYCPDFDANTRIQLKRLRQLEESHCNTMDQVADCFATLLAGASAAERDTLRRRVLEQLLYHLGRWIYLIDAVDDLKKDLRTGCYNPLVFRFCHKSGSLSEESRLALGQTLDASIRQMAAAYELADFGKYSAVIENILYEGLYLVGAAVVDGSFHRRAKRGLLRHHIGKAGPTHA